MQKTKPYIVLLGLLLTTGITLAQPVLPKVLPTNFKKDSLNIEKAGAVGDGIFLNTNAINNAISSLSKKGGGVVVVPKGIWLTGPIVLQSNINLHLKEGALLLYTTDFTQYPLVATNWEGLPQMRCASPISATNAVNIAITGSGIIDGNGDAWRMVKKDKLTESNWKRLVASGGVLGEDKKTWYPSEKSLRGSKYSNPGEIKPEKTAAFYDSVKDFLRPNLLVLANCNRILLEGVTFQNSPAWCLHPLMSSNIIVKNIQVLNPWYAQNGDGIDLESCSNVIIDNSIFDVGDDGLCMKSGRDAAGRKRGMPTQNVRITNCKVYHAHGGFVIGSEMSGGARNIIVDNCSFIGTDIGLRFKTTRGRGGLVENIYVSNIYMKDIVGEAILFDMYYMAKDPVPLEGEKRELPKVEMKPVDETTPRFTNFYIKNIVCNGAEKAIFVRGLPEMHISNIWMSNLSLQAKHGIDIQEATGIDIKNCTVLTKNTNPVIDIINSQDIHFDKIVYSPNAQLLMRLAGDRNGKIMLQHTDAGKALEKLKVELGASENQVEIKQ